MTYLRVMTIFIVYIFIYSHKQRQERRYKNNRLLHAHQVKVHRLRVRVKPHRLARHPSSRLKCLQSVWSLVQLQPLQVPPHPQQLKKRSPFSRDFSSPSSSQPQQLHPKKKSRNHQARKNQAKKNQKQKKKRRKWSQWQLQPPFDQHLVCHRPHLQQHRVYQLAVELLGTQQLLRIEEVLRSHRSPQPHQDRDMSRPALTHAQLIRKMTRRDIAREQEITSRPKSRGEFCLTFRTAHNFISHWMGSMAFN